MRRESGVGSRSTKVLRRLARLVGAWSAFVLAAAQACGDSAVNSEGRDTGLSLFRDAAWDSGPTGRGSDGATDAGTNDTDADAETDTSEDAGTTDAGTDAETTDTDADSESPDSSDPSDRSEGPGDAGPDSSPPDAGPDSGVPDTGFDAGEAPDCSVPDASFDYKCDMTKPETCPGGICLLGACIGPVLDEHRFDGCGDGTCAPCETADLCPADCGAAPPMAGAKAYANDTTISVWVHGFSNTSDADRKTMVFAEDEGCGGVLSDMKDLFGVANPCGNTNPTAPDQFTKASYYGEIPPPWMSQADADEIARFPWEGATGIRRYGLIVAKYIRHKLDMTGATHVNLACHSMGCYIIRHMIENNLENLAAENRFVRWFSSAGVIGGARLARLYDNPTVQSTAGLLGISQWDFLIMNPDLVQETTAVWDHKLFEGNNPLFSGTIIHHQAGTDPRIAQALNIQLLDLKNPGDEPNDGIMYTFDEFFRDQKPEAALIAPGGENLKAAHAYVYVDHMAVPETEATVLMGMAALFHRRKVSITLGEVELRKDREHYEAFDGEQGEPPAEIALESEVRFNPYVKDTFGRDVLVHQATVDHRSAEMYVQAVQTIANPGLVVFEGPVLDAMDSLHVDLTLVEADKYKRFGVEELRLIGAYDELAAYHGQVPLTDGAEVAFETEFARAVLGVKVTPQY
jgi:hypothetical protein